MIIPGIDKKQRRRKENILFILYNKVIEVLMIEIEMN